MDLRLCQIAPDSPNTPRSPLYPLLRQTDNRSWHKNFLT